MYNSFKSRISQAEKLCIPFTKGGECSILCGRRAKNGERREFSLKHFVVYYINFLTIPETIFTIIIFTNTQEKTQAKELSSVTI